MDFSFNEDQRAISEMAAGLFSDFCSNEQLQQHERSQQTFYNDLWRALVDTGLHALSVPETEGGSGLGITDLVAVVQQQGRYLAPCPLSTHQLAAAAIARFGSEELRRGTLPGAVRGDAILALNLGLGNGAADTLPELNAPLAAAAKSTVSGYLPAWAYAAQASFLVLAVQQQGRPHIVVLDAAADGISRVAGTLSNGEPMADVTLENVPTSEASVLSGEAFAWLQPRVIATLCAQQLGVTTEQLSQAAAYVSERVQFDRPIGSFQAVQMTAADAYIDREVLRSSLYQLCYRLDAGLGSESEALATAFLASDCGHRVGHKAQHIHGGIGVDLSYPAHRYLLWSRVLGISLGGNALNLQRLGDWMATHQTLGWKYDLEEASAPTSE